MSMAMYLSQTDHNLVFETLNGALIVLLSASVVLQVVVALGLRPALSTYTRRHGMIYCLLSPVYFWLKALIAMVALANHLCGNRVWHVTARTKRKSRRWRVALRGAK